MLAAAFRLFCLLLVIDTGYACEKPPLIPVTRCGMGEYLAPNGKVGRKQCLPCPEETFMDQEDHANLECATCDIPNELEHEVLHESCTRTKDSIILCDDGYFMQTKGPDRADQNCQRCQECGKYAKEALPYMVSPCGQYHDTACSKFCGRGQYADRQQGACEPCPEGQYMDLYRHENMECKPCSRAEDFNHEIEFGKCSKTRDSIILCEKGYYRDETPWPYKGRCVRCRICGKGDRKETPYELIPCGVYTDVKCGKKPKELADQETSELFIY